jgi:Zn finger protein HypA/HybF involved in hydrogenase expression
MTTKAQCPTCEYEWETGSLLDFVTCPNCQKKFRKVKEDKNAKKD